VTYQDDMPVEPGSPADIEQREEAARVIAEYESEAKDFAGTPEGQAGGVYVGSGQYIPAGEMEARQVAVERRMAETKAAREASKSLTDFRVGQGYDVRGADKAGLRAELKTIGFTDKDIQQAYEERGKALVERADERRTILAPLQHYKTTKDGKELYDIESFVKDRGVLKASDSADKLRKAGFAEEDIDKAVKDYLTAFGTYKGTEFVQRGGIKQWSPNVSGNVTASKGFLSGQSRQEAESRFQQEPAGLRKAVMESTLGEGKILQASMIGRDFSKLPVDEQNRVLEYYADYAGKVERIIVGGTPVLGTVVFWNEMSPGWKAISVAADVAMFIPFGKVASGLKSLTKIPAKQTVDDVLKSGRFTERTTLRSVSTPDVVKAYDVMKSAQDEFAEAFSRQKVVQKATKAFDKGEDVILFEGIPYKKAEFQSVLKEVEEIAEKTKDKFTRAGDDFINAQQKALPAKFDDTALTKGFGERQSDDVQQVIETVYGEKIKGVKSLSREYNQTLRELSRLMDSPERFWNAKQRITDLSKRLNTLEHNMKIAETGELVKLVTRRAELADKITAFKRYPTSVRNANQNVLQYLQNEQAAIDKRLPSILNNLEVITENEAGIVGRGGGSVKKVAAKGKKSSPKIEFETDIPESQSMKLLPEGRRSLPPGAPPPVQKTAKALEEAADKISDTEKHLELLERQLKRSKNPTRQEAIEKSIRETKKVITAERVKVRTFLQDFIMPEQAGARVPAKTTTRELVRREKRRVVRQPSKTTPPKKGSATKAVAKTSTGLTTKAVTATQRKASTAQKAESAERTKPIVIQRAKERPAERLREEPSEKERQAASISPKPSEQVQPQTATSTRVDEAIDTATRLREEPSPAPAPKPHPRPVPKPTKAPTKTPEPVQPKKRIPLPLRGKAEKGKDWTQAEVKSAVGFKQGFSVVGVKAPYEKPEDVKTFNVKAVPKELRVISLKKGKGTASASFQPLTGAPKKETQLDIGVVDAIFSRKGLRFRGDAKQRTQGNLTIKKSGFSSKREGRIFRTRIGKRNVLSRQPLGRRKRS